MGAVAATEVKPLLRLVLAVLTHISFWGYIPIRAIPVPPVSLTLRALVLTEVWWWGGRERVGSE